MFTNSSLSVLWASVAEWPSSMLLLLLLLHKSWANDVPRDTNFVVRPASPCPDVGYFFRQDPMPNSVGPGTCYLCFCQDDGTAVCWRRENRRCDGGSYLRADGRRDTRVRRSPGLSDIFFRDATRDVFNRNTPQTCKPFESSFSEGCPPADWCIGCTVCDCDANGRWDCHILSFCPDKENKAVMRTAKKPLKKPKKSTAKKPSQHTKPRTTTMIKPTRTRPGNGVTRRPGRRVRTARPKHSPSKNFNRSPKPLIIKKHVSTRKPVLLNLKSNKLKLNATEREVITQEVVKRVVTAMQRLLSKSQMINKELLKVLPSPKTLQKRSMDKKPGPNNVNKYKPASAKKKLYKSAVPSKNKRNKPVNVNQKAVSNTGTNDFKKNFRQKRDLGLNIITSSKDSSAENEIFNKETTIDNYDKYSVVTQYPSREANYKAPGNFLSVDSFKDINVTILQPQSKPDQKQFITTKYSSDKDANIINGYKPSINTTKMYEFTLLHNSTKWDKIQHSLTNLTTNEIDPKPYIKKQLFPQDNKILKDNSKEHNKREKKKEESFKGTVFQKIDDIQNVLKKLLNDFRRNRTRAVKTKARKLHVMKYLKKLFKKIFLNSDKTPDRKLTENIKRKNVIEAICEVFGNCNEKQKNKKILKSKIRLLDLESNNILKSIKIIKGILHLFDFSNFSNAHNITLKDDIHKLNFILKGEYDKTNQELTHIQRTQVNYVQRNTQAFIQAVGRFANILTDIITVLVKNTSSDVYSNRRNIERKVIKKEPSNETVTKELSKIKNLLIKYNLVQNTFLRKMYNILNKFGESQDPKHAKVSEKNVTKNNTSVAIENFSKNIIQNLRKLKNLAEIMNSNRKKRSVSRDDDTVEYLLTLMEYLIKQNYPLDDAPVIDGIDLLVEAIKNAPDIKTTKKKVLYDILGNVRVRKTTEASARKSYNENTYDSKGKVSFEEIATNKQSVSKLATIEHTPDSAGQRYYKYHPVDNAYDENTKSVYTEKDDIKRQNENYIETTLSYGKIVGEESDDDIEDYDIETSSATTTTQVYYDNEPTTSTTDAAADTTEFKIAKLKNYIAKDDDSSSSDSRNHRISLDWLNENYDREVKEVNRRKSHNTTTTPVIRTLTTTRKPFSPKNVDTVSSITKEFSDEEGKRRFTKLNAEEVMHKKQMDLLNSLDYGTEKSELEETDSKDDVFSSYYS